MEENMEIIEATDDEYEIVCELCKELDLYHVGIDPERVKEYTDIPRTPEQYYAYISGDKRVLLLAMVEDVAVGFVNMIITNIQEKVMRVGRSFAFLDNMFVSASYRDRGVGSDLFESALDWCKKNGIRKIKLQAYSSNKSALKFYNAKGFSSFMHRMELDIEAE